MFPPFLVFLACARALLRNDENYCAEPLASQAFPGGRMKSLRSLFVLTAMGAFDAFATDPAFTLTASAADWNHYFPSYLANGYLSTPTAPRGT
jgi:hypothetical protein